MSGSPFMNRGNPKDKGSHGRRAESLVAKRLGGKQQPGSGAIAGAKGDITLDTKYNFLIENKASSGKSFSLPKDWLYKISREAIASERVPALAFQFTDSQGRSDRQDRFVIIPEWLFQELTDCN